MNSFNHASLLLRSFSESEYLPFTNSEYASDRRVSKTVEIVSSSSSSTSNLEKLISIEKKSGIYDIKTYKMFARNVKQLKNLLQNELKKCKTEGKTIFGYGAPAKGNVLLNYCDIGKEFLDYILDTTPLKQGLYTPGTHIPVRLYQTLPKNASQYVALLLAWNYEKDIVQKENEFRKNGGRFLVPIPTPKIIGV